MNFQKKNEQKRSAHHQINNITANIPSAVLVVVIEKKCLLVVQRQEIIIKAMCNINVLKGVNCVIKGKLMIQKKGNNKKK